MEEEGWDRERKTRNMSDREWQEIRVVEEDEGE